MESKHSRLVWPKQSQVFSEQVFSTFFGTSNPYEALNGTLFCKYHLLAVLERHILPQHLKLLLDAHSPGMLAKGIVSLVCLSSMYTNILKCRHALRRFCSKGTCCSCRLGVKLREHGSNSNSAAGCSEHGELAQQSHGIDFFLA